MAIYQAICAGDETALEQLIAEYRVPMTCFIRGIVHSAEDAEDIAIDTFAALITSRGRFQGKSSLKTYLYGIARHLAIREQRRSAARQTAPFPSEACMQLSSFGDSAEDQWLYHQEREELYAGMGRLTPDYRQALMLVYMQGMSYKEAGEIMGKNLSQLTHLITRAKAALRRALEEA